MIIYLFTLKTAHDDDELHPIKKKYFIQLLLNHIVISMFF